MMAAPPRVAMPPLALGKLQVSAAAGQSRGFTPPDIKWQGPMSNPPTPPPLSLPNPLSGFQLTPGLSPRGPMSPRGLSLASPVVTPLSFAGQVLNYHRLAVHSPVTSPVGSPFQSPRAQIVQPSPRSSPAMGANYRLRP